MNARSGLRGVQMGVVLAGLCALTGAARAAPADDEPTIAKDSVRARVLTNVGSPSVWVPGIQFRVNGPVASGSQLWVQFDLPGKKPWLKFDCEVGEVKSGAWWDTRCGVVEGRATSPVPQEKYVTYTGMVDFSIHWSNELAGKKTTLFAGKMKVGKFRPRPNTADNYFVDDDWAIPIGYLFLEDSPPFLHSKMWFRGNPGDVRGYLFYQGKQLAEDYCNIGLNSEWNPAKPEWAPIECKFRGVYRDDPPAGGAVEPKHALTKNPGEYEIKMLSAGHLARSAKFTVDANGKFDNGIAAANKLGSDRVIVPVRVLGDQGPWDRAAWKTRAFYGNPLTGFTAAQ